MYNKNQFITLTHYLFNNKLSLPVMKASLTYPNKDWSVFKMLYSFVLCSFVYVIEGPFEGGLGKKYHFAVKT